MLEKTLESPLDIQGRKNAKGRRYKSATSISFLAQYKENP